jgi:carbon storage regulator
VLILTRRPGERVVINEDILIEVMAVSGHTVRLGISAPEGVSIYREEIWLAVTEENRAAAAADPKTLPTSGPSGPAAPPAKDDPKDAESRAQTSGEESRGPGEKPS